jgi:ribosomal protein S18 acetylase RimI-like enzyme
MTHLTFADPDHPALTPLVGGLAAEYRRLYGALTDGELERHDPSEFRAPGGATLVIVEDDETLAGGALRRWDDGTGEIKRMWTAPAHRRRGHAQRILSALEDVAAAIGYRSVRLQTGARQHAAIALYTAAGYRRIPCYGHYAGNPLCLSFEKALR